MAELKSSLKKNLDVKQMLSNSFKQQSNVNTSQPTQINDLSSLIKKRKADDTPKSSNTEENKSESKKEDTKEPEAKKAKVDDESKESKEKEAK